MLDRLYTRQILFVTLPVCIFYCMPHLGADCAQAAKEGGLDLDPEEVVKEALHPGLMQVRGEGLTSLISTPNLLHSTS